MGLMVMGKKQNKNKKKQKGTCLVSLSPSMNEIARSQGLCNRREFNNGTICGSVDRFKRNHRNSKVYYQWEIVTISLFREHREIRMLLKLDYNYNLGRVTIQQKMNFYIEVIYTAREEGEEK